MKIDVALAKNLIETQFPHWKELPIKPVKVGGWDNRTFHLGRGMSMRLPSSKVYEPQILKESKWLPLLAKKLNIKITKPIAVGKPCDAYPLHWAINEWIDGEPASKSNISNRLQFANEIAAFLVELQAIDASNGPQAGPHSFYRGGELAVYAEEMSKALPNIKDATERSVATALWNDAVSSQWTNSPVWTHGDFAHGNLLVKDGRLEAIIDFGCLAVGDPACDLAVAWNLLDKASRQVFKQAVGLDDATWVRGMGWTLWKTLCWPIANTPIKQLLCELYADYAQML